MGTMPVDYSSLLLNPDLRPTGYDPYTGMAVDYSQSDPGYAMKQDRGLAATWGQNVANRLGTEEGAQDYYQQFYRGPMNLAGFQLGTTPGYTPEEFANITRPEAYQAGVTTPEEYAALDPTSEEAAAIRGDPSTYSRYLDQYQPAAAENVRQGQDVQESDINRATRGMTSAYDTEEGQFRAAAADPSLTPSAGYYDAMAGALTGAQTGVRSALDPSRLDLSLDPNKYLMGDPERQQIMSQAAENVRLSNEALNQREQAEAEASGNMDPAAMAALRSQNQIRSQSATADAVTQADLASRAQQRQLEMDYAQAKLGAGQTRAGMESGAALSLGQLGENVAQTAEQTELGAGQYRAGLTSGQAQTVAGQRAGEEQWQAGAGIGVSQANQQLYSDALKFAAATGTSINEAMDAVQSGRASQLYQARQGNLQYAQQSKFGQNLSTNEQLSNLYSQAANARQSGQQRFLDWTTGQTGAATGAGLQYSSQGLTAGATTLGNINQATGQWGNYDIARRGQGFGASFFPQLGKSLGTVGVSYGGGGAFGKRGWYVDQPTTVHLGEGHKPEAVLPLDPDTPPDRRNIWEHLGAELGEKLGVHGRGPGEDMYTEEGEREIGGRPPGHRQWMERYMERGGIMGTAPSNLERLSRAMKYREVLDPAIHTMISSSPRIKPPSIPHTGAPRLGMPRLNSPIMRLKVPSLQV